MNIVICKLQDLHAKSGRLKFENCKWLKLFSPSQFNDDPIQFDKSVTIVEFIKYETAFPPQNSGSARQLPVAVQNGC